MIQPICLQTVDKIQKSIRIFEGQSKQENAVCVCVCVLTLTKMGSHNLCALPNSENFLKYPLERLFILQTPKLDVCVCIGMRSMRFQYQMLKNHCWERLPFQKMIIYIVFGCGSLCNRNTIHE